MEDNIANTKVDDYVTKFMKEHYGIEGFTAADMALNAEKAIERNRPKWEQQAREAAENWEQHPFVQEMRAKAAAAKSAEASKAKNTTKKGDANKVEAVDKQPASKAASKKGAPSDQKGEPRSSTRLAPRHARLTFPRRRQVIVVPVSWTDWDRVDHWSVSFKLGKGCVYRRRKKGEAPCHGTGNWRTMDLWA